MFIAVYYSDNSYAINFQMILETLRMASIISFTFREAVADVEYKGKIILHDNNSM